MNLTTQWLGLELKNPFVPSASPLSRSLDTAKQLEDAGAAAIVMYSLFEEAVRGEEEGMTRFLHHQDTGHAEAESYLPSHQDFPGELDRYLEQVASLKATLEIPVIASLNGVTASGWMTHATEIADAGADALELNAYYVAGDIWEEGHYVEQRYITLLKELHEHIDIPINMKLSPFFSSIGNMVKKLEAAGIGGVSLFNRFYQPDIHIDGLRLQHALTPIALQRRLVGDALDRDTPWPGRVLVGRDGWRSRYRRRDQGVAGRRRRRTPVLGTAGKGPRTSRRHCQRDRRLDGRTGIRTTGRFPRPPQPAQRAGPVRL